MTTKSKAAKKPPPFDYSTRYQGGPGVIRAREILRPYVEAGERVDFATLAEQHDMSVDTFERAIYAEVAYQEGRGQGLVEAPIDASILNAPHTKKFDRLKARLEAQMEMAVYQKTAQHIQDVVMPLYAEKLKKADVVLNRAGSTVFTNTEYRVILAALHPDSGPAARQRAFILFSEKELALRGVDQPLSNGLPNTLAELLAMRAAAKEARRKRARA
jgi:hypothetical protein